MKTLIRTFLGLLILSVLITVLFFVWGNAPESRVTRLSESEPPGTNRGSGLVLGHAARSGLSSNLSQTPIASVGGNLPSVAVASPRRDGVQNRGEPHSDAARPGVLPAGSEQWMQPIAFHGKVVDELERPLPGVSVRFIWSDVSAKGTSTATATSDSAGLFGLIDAQGMGLSVELSKPGYRVAQKNARFDFEYRWSTNRNYHRPDPLNPVVYRMRSIGEGVRLLTSRRGVTPDIRVSVPVNGEAVAVDFFAREPAPGGPLLIRQFKPPAKEWQEAQEWRLQMEIRDGGFVEHDDEFPFHAPEFGYHPSVEFRFSRESPDWQTHSERQFYISFGTPRRYGWLKLWTAIGTDAVRLEYAINPDGATYLEPLRPRAPE